MKKNILFLAVASLLLVACDNQSLDNQYSNEIRINASLGETRATLSNFEPGDKMSLYAVEYNGEEVAEVQTAGNYINNEEMTYDGSEWSSARTLYWSENPCDFYGFYPYRPTGSMKDVYFEVAADQSKPTADGVLGGYEASDLMWAKTEKVSRNDGTVNLLFHHMMTRVVVEIVRGASYEGELPEDITVHLYNTVTTALVDWTAGMLEVYPLAPRKTITMRQLDADSFDAIVVPQFIERRTPLVEITMEGIAYLLETSMSFRPGKQHTLTLTLNTSPDQEKIEIDIDGDISDWQ
ncbi:MAG: fimbrillin family protein [Bacteroidales bacterium]|nr:fimbrillin family protein [Bacteroidales bacterium]